MSVPDLAPDDDDDDDDDNIYHKSGVHVSLGLGD